jgi:DNA adenine methylase
MSQLSKPPLSEAHSLATPIIKWAGGKSSLLAQFKPFFPSTYNRYLEPFIGGGAVFFYLQPPQSYLLDLNPHLIELYQVVQNSVDQLIDALSQHWYDKEHFYRVRAQDTALMTPVERAARFIFLNKTCYNGLYRENNKGAFNVPFGKHINPAICDENALRAANIRLQSARFEVADFECILDVAENGDLVYFDPPYVPLSTTSSFTTYTKNGFTVEDQRRLADTYRKLDERGCLLLLSNSNAPLVYELYKNYTVHEISARRAINSKAHGRGVIKELLIMNY